MKTVTKRGKRIEVSETDLLNTSQLAEYIGVSRWTIHNHVKNGYVYEYGGRTTAAHFLAWLRRQSALLSTSHPKAKASVTGSKKAHALSQLC